MPNTVLRLKIAGLRALLWITDPDGPFMTYGPAVVVALAVVVAAIALGLCHA